MGFFTVEGKHLKRIVAIVPQHVEDRPHRRQRPGVNQRQIDGQRGIFLPQALAGFTPQPRLAEPVSEVEIERAQRQ
ncbi:hypothetical protein SDC9_148949 [bioreactor metagenome]|uniref:Uncharacterized protein n=1 Tax=bioreactor metagenome TaxID=1076179 RepID=A0A645EIA3_9ZZZZ